MLIQQYNRFLYGQIPGGRGGGTLKLSYIRSLGSFFGGFKILKFNIFGGFSEILMSFKLGYEYFVDIFSGSS